MRWLAVVGQLATVFYVRYGLGIPLQLQPMAAVVIVLVSLNIFSLYLLRARLSIHNAEIFLALIVDVGALTALLYFSGGATNPFIWLYLLQVTLAAVLLEAWSTWTLVVMTSGAFVWLAINRDTLVIPGSGDGAQVNLYLQGEFICYVLAATLLVSFITRINRNMRARDRSLEDLRQRSIEEDHIVRLGLMASGAAHELGTPLSTMSVILNDWQHMSKLEQDADMSDDIAEMQAQLSRCKAILSDILLSSGEVRGEGTYRTTMRTFFDDVAAIWQQTRAPARFVYLNDYTPDVPIISDKALQQILFNVLDNGIEASPAWVSLSVVRDAAYVVITVADRGPGFSEAMLNSLGQPYRSTKDRSGRGLGLFLVVNVVRKLGGTVTATNSASGGASVRLVLPTDALIKE